MKCLWCEDPLSKNREGISQFCDAYCQECYEIVVKGKQVEMEEEKGGEG